MTLGTDINALLRDEINTHLFFNAMLQLFKNQHSIGESKARQILGAVATPGRRYCIPRAREFSNYRPIDPRLYLNDQLRSSLIALSEEYYEPRKIGPAYINIKVIAKARFKTLEVSINQCRLKLRLDNSLHLWLHREIGNSLYYKQLAVLTAIRQFAFCTSKAQIFCEQNPDIVDLTVSCSARKYIVLGVSDESEVADLS